MALIAYGRVSTSEQSLDLQLDAFEKAHADKVFTDHGVSGTLASRPQLDAALAYLREGDTLLVWKLDRLGRNTRHVLQLLEDLQHRGVAFRSVTEGLDTSGPMGKAMVTVLAAFNALERDVLIERTKAGLEVARAKGKLGGRPKALTPKKIATAQMLYDSGEHAVKDIATTLGVGTATVYRYLAAERNKNLVSA